MTSSLIDILMNLPDDDLKKMGCAIEPSPETAESRLRIADPMTWMTGHSTSSYSISQEAVAFINGIK